MAERPIIRQLEVGPIANFAYIVACSQTKQAILVDPVAEADRLLAELQSLSATLIAVVNTHGHVDHVAGNAEIKRRTGVPIIAHSNAGLGQTDAMTAHFLRMLGGDASPPADRTVDHGDRIELGELSVEVVHTPGHTPGDICLYVGGSVFTGDTLFVGGVGRTDLRGSSSQSLAASLRDRLAKLPDDTTVYPGHNYGPTPTSTIGAEKRHNPFFQAAF